MSLFTALKGWLMNSFRDLCHYVLQLKCWELACRSSHGYQWQQNYQKGFLWLSVILRYQRVGEVFDWSLDSLTCSETLGSANINTVIMRQIGPFGQLGCGVFNLAVSVAVAVNAAPMTRA